MISYVTYDPPSKTQSHSKLNCLSVTGHRTFYVRPLRSAILPRGTWREQREGTKKARDTRLPSVMRNSDGWQGKTRACTRVHAALDGRCTLSSLVNGERTAASGLRVIAGKTRALGVGPCSTRAASTFRNSNSFVRDVR